MSPEEQDQILRSILTHKLEEIFPEKSVRVSNQDDPFVTSEIKKLQMYLKREYKKKGKSEKYMKLKSAYDKKYQNLAKNQLEKNIEDMMKENPGQAYRALKKMGARPGDCENSADFQVLAHQKENLTLEQSTDRILKYFSSISQQYLPLDVAKLSQHIQEKLGPENIQIKDIPYIEAHHIHEKMKKCKTTKSAVPGEFPARLRQQFNVELAGPAAIIFNNIAKTGIWPQSWKKEYGTVLKKVTSSPEDESQLRIISITYQLSTLMERFVIDWLLIYIEDKLDRDQFGGQKGHSIAHYLIEITNFILYNQDQSKPLSTMFAGVDISKGFNKIDHSKLVTILDEMNVPGWLLRIVVSYLSGRSLTLRRQSHTTDTEEMPGGTGAGTPLGLLCFLIIFNGAGPAASKVSLGQQVTDTKRKPMKKGKVKWIDDLSVMAALHLPSSLVPDTRPDIPRPVSYRGRHGLRLPDELNELQSELDCLNLYAENHLMSINHLKTKVLLFSRHRKYDFLPEIQLIQNTNIKVVEEMKIVGFVLRSDLKTISNTNYIIGKAYGRMWVVRRLKTLGASRARLIDVLQKQVLSVLNLGVPAWDCFLTCQERADLERVLKTGLRIIWGHSYTTFEQVLLESGLKTLQETRNKIVRKFVRRKTENNKFRNWFCRQKETNFTTRLNNRKHFKPVIARHEFYRRSCIPTLTELANTTIKK